MAKLKLTKPELKRQKAALRRFERYLPLLQLKKRQLQREVDRVRQELVDSRAKLEEASKSAEEWSGLLAEDIGLKELFVLEGVEVRWENIAGMDVPMFEQARIRVEDYDLFALPLWVDAAVAALREIISLSAAVEVLAEQERRFARELRLTAQRVNLFEQVKIPDARENIRRITVYLGDQQTAAFGWALMARRKLQAAEKGGNA
ncbi:MAG: V-type ATP synthase subunit D [Oceanipulchritudo sp.]